MIGFPFEAVNLKSFTVTINCNRICRIRLYFHTIRAGLCRPSYNLQRILQFSGMVGAHFRNDVYLSGTDGIK